MVEFACFFTLEVSHPLIAPAAWIMLPDAPCERYLGKNRLRLRQMGGKAVFWGDETMPPQQAGPEESHSFFLFCADPYFQRCTEVPNFAPGRELLELPLDGENCAMKVGTCDDSVIRDVAAQRKRHMGAAFGLPPVGRVTFPARDVSQRETLRLDFAPRRAYWRYEIAPKVSAPVELAGTCVFTRLESGEGLTFQSEERLSIAPPFPRVSLMLADGNGPAFPLMENLPAPTPSQMTWDRELVAYIGVVRLDLRHFGIVS